VGGCNSCTNLTGPDVIPHAAPRLLLEVFLPLN
jgi:hypothetical protein